jgi:hypothetical protein
VEWWGDVGRSDDVDGVESDSECSDVERGVGRERGVDEGWEWGAGVERGKYLQRGDDGESWGIEHRE